MKKNSTNLRGAVCFRRWTRKNYAVFNSLQKVVKIGTLSLGCSLLLAKTEKALAQTDSLNSSRTIPLTEVVIAEENREVYSDLSRIVTVLRKEEIARLPVQNLTDLLEYVMSADLRQRGANGVQADLSIRGGTFDQVLVLLNGINITDPQTGHHNLNIPVDLASIDRIEVLQGPGSRVLGPNAFSGAINIVTGSSSKSGVQAQVSGGQHGYLMQGGSATLSTRRFTTFAAASNTRSSGYTTNTDFNLTNVFLQSRFDDGHNGNLNLQLGYQEKGFGANGFYSLTYPNQYEKTRTFLSSLRYSKKIGKFSFVPALYHRRHHDRFELFRDNPASWYTGHNYHQTDVLGANLNASYRSGLGKTTFGADFRNEHIYSSNLGELLPEPKNVPFETNENAKFLRGKDRNSLSWFVEHTVFLNRFAASAGVLGNFNSFKDRLFFGTDLSYDLSQSLKVYGTVNQSLRLPTFTDLYYTGPTNVGNPNLKPEEATTYEAGLKLQRQQVRAHMAAFTRRGKNIIDWVRETETDKWQSRNLVNVNSSGLEASVEYVPQEPLQPYFRSVKIAYSYLQLDKNSGSYYSSYVLDYLKHKIIGGLDHGIYKKFGASWRVVHQQRQGQYLNFETKENTAYEPFTLVDLKLYWQNQTVTIFAEATNLLDKKYFDYGSLEQPGRWLKTGIAVRLQ